MSPLVETFGITAGIVFALMTALWGVSLARRDASIVDPFWGAGFVIVAWTSVLCRESYDARSILLSVLTTIWGLRLSLYLAWRNSGHGEDRRYQAMRRHHGARFWWVSLLTVFWLQAGILWFVSLPIQVAAANHSSTSVGWIDVAGALVWIVGFFFEAVGDWQLTRFQRDPANAGRVLDRGLWRYTRHPNYFGDFCVWWGLYLISLGSGAWWTIASPIVMSVLLLKVSGVTLLEQTIVDRRPDYAAYQARTNAFVPGPPRRR